MLSDTHLRLQNNPNAPKLLTLEETYNLDLKAIRQYYKTYVNPGIEDAIYSFAFGEDIVERAEGIWMYFKQSGKKVFDATGGMGVLNLGHNHPRILKARIDFQQKQKMEVHKAIFSPYMAALSHNFAALFDNKLQYSFFCNSGAEGVEGALKTAYKYHNGKRNHVLYSNISYHGKTMGAASVTGSKEITFKFPTIPGTDSFVYNSIESIKEKLAQHRTKENKSDIYAIIVEPYSISTLTPCNDDFLYELRRLCNEKDIVLIFDEVFSGWYKMGPLFYFMKSGVYPDIMVTSKTMGGGKASISAFISSPKIYLRAFGGTMDAFLHSTTYNGFGEECITALEAINIMFEEDIAAKTLYIENVLCFWLPAMKTKYKDKILSWRGNGSFFSFQLKVMPDILGKIAELIPIEMTKDKLLVNKIESAAFCDFLFRDYDIHTLFGGQGEIHIIFAPAAIVSPDDLNEALIKIDSAFDRFSAKHVVDFALRKFKKKVLN